MGFWDFFWLMVWGFLFVAYLMVLFQVIADIFRDRSLKGWAKTLWLIGLFIAPPLTALVYIIARGRGMGEREYQASEESRLATERYVRSVAGSDGAAEAIAKGKALLDSGAITADEFAQLKGKALA